MIKTSIADLRNLADSVEAVHPDDGKSFSTFERFTIDGDRYFLKRLNPKTDWIMRVANDRVHRPFLIWKAGIMDRIPDCIDHTVVAMEIDGDGYGATLSILMRDIGEHLVPEGHSVVSLAVHQGFIDHLAQLAAGFWGWEDTTGELSTMTERVRFFDAPNVARELAVADPPDPIVAADAGWRALPKRAPDLAHVAREVQEHPELLTVPLTATPSTFLHGDWKMGNLGTHPDGRTILLDWAYPGSGPVCWDLWWYIALNRLRLPESKEATIERFRWALESHGIPTDSWFQTQLDLCAIGMMATFGWEKALDSEDDELMWWDYRVREAIDRQKLDLPRRGA